MLQAKSQDFGCTLLQPRNPLHVQVPMRTRAAARTDFGHAPLLLPAMPKFGGSGFGGRKAR